MTVAIQRPSLLPPNGRIAVAWSLVRPDRAADQIATPPTGGPRAIDPAGIAGAPTAGWRKVLHALDPDVTLVYQAPLAGIYRLSMAPVVEEPHVGESSRWREKGAAPEMFPVPSRTPWPDGAVAPMVVSLRPLVLPTDEQSQQAGTWVEAEPNDTPEQAQPIALPGGDPARTVEITGTGDDVEYFDNGRVGRSGDDWFRVEFRGVEPRLLSAELSIPGQWVAARVRCYRLDGSVPGASLRRLPLGALLPVSEFLGEVNPQKLPWQEGKQIQFAEGMDPNERSHQQEEQHRTHITRLLQPGRVYYLRVEANAPGYQLQLRVSRPAPYADPETAVRQAMYTHVGQVDAWLTNRPRGASIERRIRDSGNLLGTQCMSCHTQSGVWGPAVPVLQGYRVENVQNYWRLLNTMYECLRPTNELQNAANNTSLAPLDIGDGPAGTRAAGFNIVQAERIIPPRKLHASQQIRTANYVLLTADPGGINAAGPGSNVGQNIVYLFTGEILQTAWRKTGDWRYFRALQDRARKVLNLDPRFTDDIGVRLDFFGRLLPLATYADQARRADEAERAAGRVVADGDPGAFVETVRQKLAEDERRLRAIQNPDGSWGFQPGTTRDGGQTWERGGTDWDPSPTALALTGLAAVGRGKNDPAVARGVQALLRMQDPNGRWNRAAITGFVPTAYAMNALARLYPVKPSIPKRADFIPRPTEDLAETVRRVQAMALAALPECQDLLTQAARDTRLPVRWWGLLGLGAIHRESAVPILTAALSDSAKPIREVATWALRQTLLDDQGWSPTLLAAERGDDRAREAAIQALGMRADAVMPQARIDWARLGRLFDRAINDDPSAGVRAWATKSAWQWWIWNPPIRAAVNSAWVRMFERPESNLLVENSNRYSSQALFIANGHKANGSQQHQYKELAQLFETLRQRLERAQPQLKSLLARRLVAVAATFYQTAGGDGGPGQMGYTTPGAGALFGQAVVVYMREEQPRGERRAILAGLEGAANVPHGPLQEYLINYTLNAPEDLRQAAAAAVSDPRSATLQAAIELVEPLIQQIRRGAMDPARRATLSDPVLKLFSTVTWVIPKDEEQQMRFLDLMIPRFETYATPEQIATEPDAGKRQQLERQMTADWYLADRLGQVMAENPDLHLELVFRRFFPAEFRNPLERHFWIRSVPWLLEIKAAAATPAAGAPPVQEPAAPMKIDPNLIIRDRALQLFLDSLKPTAPAETRAAAIRAANAPSVRRNPEVLRALRDLLETEKDEQLRKIAENVVKQGSDRFIPDLLAALKAEGRPGRWLTDAGRVDPRVLADLTAFRDEVLPELVRVKRGDQMACMGCHGIPGRVPSLTLRPTDEFGYQNVTDLLFNYRELQARIDYRDVERSKILRKPLNVQDGKEDGHQGGRRYLPQDEGYLLIKRWVTAQPRLHTDLMAPFPGSPAGGTGNADKAGAAPR